MSLKAHEQGFQQIWQHLLQQWQQTTASWNDQTQRQFEQEFWRPLSTLPPTVIRELQNLDRVITQAKQSVH